MNQGTLSYSNQPSGVCKGSADLKNSVITFFPKRLMFIVDSGSYIFHLKCVEREDFDKWLAVLKRYENFMGEQQYNSESMRKKLDTEIDIAKWSDALQDSMMGFNEELGNLKTGMNSLALQVSCSHDNSNGTKRTMV